MTERDQAPRQARPLGLLAQIQDGHERTLRNILDVLYDERLSAEERIARAGNSPSFDPVRDGRPPFPWPVKLGVGDGAELPAVGSFHG